MTPQDSIRHLPLWTGPVTIEPLGGGITNLNYLVRDDNRKAVVRLGQDIPIHHILRSNELAASRAAHLAGVSPAVLHHEPGILVITFIEGRTLCAADMQGATLDRALDLVAKAHRDIPKHLRGPAQIFWVFHTLRDYVATLHEAQSPHAPRLPALMTAAQTLEHAVGPIDLIFGHNDLLPANFIDDGTRLWLIDWDYAGFNSPLFDLGGLAANNHLNPDQETHLLTRYFAKAPDIALIHRYRAMKAAAALRETLWSMVSEHHSTLDFNFAAYTEANFATYHAAFTAFQQS